MSSNQEILLTCKRCNKKSPVKEMKYDLNGKDLLCGRCYEVRIASAKPKTHASYADESKAKFEFTSVLDGKQEVKYFCPKCKFHFKRKKEHGFPKACPYCNKPTVILDERRSAEHLLKEATKREYDY